MKKTSLVCIILAGVCLLVGVLFKVHVLPRSFLDTVPSTWIQLSQLFLVASIALKCCCHCCTCEKKTE